MRAGDESFERLRKAIDELAVGDAAELLSEARAEARARVRSMLSDALAQSIHRIFYALRPSKAGRRV